MLDNKKIFFFVHDYLKGILAFKTIREPKTGKERQEGERNKMSKTVGTTRTQASQIRKDEPVFQKKAP